MPLYYLHIEDGTDWVEDPDGYELPDLAAAEREAIEAARAIVADAIRAGRNPVGHALVIADEQGRELGRVRFVDALPEKLRLQLQHA